jgi:hypothetical protein
MQLAGTGFILMVLSILPLLFLLYSIINHEKLNITLTHPRIAVETVIFLISGLVLCFIP